MPVLPPIVRRHLLLGAFALAACDGALASGHAAEPVAASAAAAVEKKAASAPAPEAEVAPTDDEAGAGSRAAGDGSG